MTNSVKMLDGNAIPKLGLGVWQASNEQVVSAIHAAFDAGYRLIDTASVYENESGVGTAIKSSNLAREDIFVTSKLWNKDQGNVQKALEKSLTLLELDYLDCYLIHWPAPSLGQYTNAWKELIKAQHSGLIKSIGVSNFLPEHIDTLIQQTGITPVINQIEKHPLFSQQSLSKWCTERDILVQAWSPLAQGGEGIFERPEVMAIAAAHQKSPAQVVLRWHIQKNTLVIPKSVTPSRIAENIDVFDFVLTPDELKTIDALDKNQRLGPDPLDFV
ncbi:MULTISPECIES: aldo/keto reductase [Aliiglaciecola]|uniref:aldo/keto reductase n=1 Tax=Aliiglaciecola TaxID=1406885 RepID=UPI0020905DE1|nr:MULTISPECIES: aldo/keto reductase [Aliiglaciecola]MDO6710733.1 aldo/keto reductase [Aliiglaciecola sp. 2_MG-2023]MDO6751859.1 aldo/keto reductase [Aliiglaciecola sp. 1_MG-2023]